MAKNVQPDLRRLHNMQKACEMVPRSLSGLHCLLWKRLALMGAILLQMCVGSGCVFPIWPWNWKQRLKDKIYCIAFYLLMEGGLDGCIWFQRDIIYIWGFYPADMGSYFYFIYVFHYFWVFIVPILFHCWPCKYIHYTHMTMLPYTHLRVCPCAYTLLQTHVCF